MTSNPRNQISWCIYFTKLFIQRQFSTDAEIRVLTDNHDSGLSSNSSPLKQRRFCWQRLMKMSITAETVRLSGQKADEETCYCWNNETLSANVETLLLAEQRQRPKRHSPYVGKGRRRSLLLAEQRQRAKRHSPHPGKGRRSSLAISWAETEPKETLSLHWQRLTKKPAINQTEAETKETFSTFAKADREALLLTK